MDARTQRSNLFVLASGQALTMTGASVTMTASALVGRMLAADASLATLPVAVQVTASMLATIPASLLMRRAGRRLGFSLGSVLGIAGGLLGAHAIMHASFLLFCLGSALIGAALGFVTFYRFAAADHGDERSRSRAISLVMAGGIVAAIAGPELAKRSVDLLAPLAFAGCFLVIAVLNVAALAVVQWLRLPLPTAAERQDSGRPLGVIARQPAFIIAVLAATIAYAVMTLVMTATPLAMLACGFEFGPTAFVLQWHALGMFVPSFFTGYLINRFGVLRLMAVGAALLLACVAVNLTGLKIAQFWTGLVLLGVGWNFLFIGGTSLLTQTYAPAERAKVQALNDFLVFGLAAAASFLSGAIHSGIGWAAVNLAVIVPVLVVFVGLIWLRQKRAAAAGDAVPARPAA
jgi:MFS family permease